MSQIRLYLDEDAMRRSIVFALRARNVDILTASEAQMINRGDKEHLAVAAASGRTLYTFNVADYCLLHKSFLSQEQPHAGIIVSPQQRYPVGDELRRIMRLVSLLSAEEMRNRIVFLSAF